MNLNLTQSPYIQLGELRNLADEFSQTDLLTCIPSMAANQIVEFGNEELVYIEKIFKALNELNLTPRMKLECGASLRKIVDFNKQIKLNSQAIPASYFQFRSIAGRALSRSEQKMVNNTISQLNQINQKINNLIKTLHIEDVLREEQEASGLYIVTEKTKVFDLNDRIHFNTLDNRRQLSTSRQKVAEILRDHMDSIQNNFAPGMLEIDNLPTILANDENLMLKIAQENGLLLRLASPELRNNKTLVYAALRKNIQALSFVGEELKAHFQLIKDCFIQQLKDECELEANPVAHETFLLKKEDFSLKLYLALSDKDITSNIDLMRIICKHIPEAVYFASEEVAHLIIKDHPLALRYAHRNIQKNSEIVLEAVKKDGLAFEFAHPTLQDDFGIAFKAFRENNLVTQFLNPDLMALFSDLSDCFDYFIELRNKWGNQDVDTIEKKFKVIENIILFLKSFKDISQFDQEGKEFIQPGFPTKQLIRFFTNKGVETLSLENLEQLKEDLQNGTIDFLKVEPKSQVKSARKIDR